MAKKRKKKSSLKKIKKVSSFRKGLKKASKGLKRKRGNKKIVAPQWTLEDGVTYSILSKFLNCRQRFHIGQVQGWKPKHINYALEFGNIFHLFIEAQDQGFDMEQIKRIGTNYIMRKIEEKSCSSDEIKELTALSLIAACTFEHYINYWKANPVEFYEKAYFEKNFSWMEKEHSFDIDYTMVNGRKVRLRGKIDGLFQIKKTIEGLWILETKTKGRIDADQITKGLHKDMQTGMYSLAVRKISRGTMPKGVLYNVIRRTQLKPRKNESAVDFAARVDEDIQERPEWYFMRWVRELTMEELDDFRLRQFEPALNQVCKWWDSIKKNPMDPYVTECSSCDLPWGIDEEEDLEASLDNINCSVCSGTKRVPNLEHYERAFGTYDAMQFTDKGDYFPIITEDDYSLYERKSHAFPELDSDEDDLNLYLEGT
jgi:hypothetical protein